MQAEEAHELAQDSEFVLAMRPHALQAARELCFFRMCILPIHLRVLIYTDTAHCQKVLDGAKMLLHGKRGNAD